LNSSPGHIFDALEGTSDLKADPELSHPDFQVLPSQALSVTFNLY